MKPRHSSAQEWHAFPRNHTVLPATQAFIAAEAGSHSLPTALLLFVIRYYSVINVQKPSFYNHCVTATV